MDILILLAMFLLIPPLVVGVYFFVLHDRKRRARHRHRHHHRIDLEHKHSAPHGTAKLDEG